MRTAGGHPQEAEIHVSPRARLRLVCAMLAFCKTKHPDKSDDQKELYSRWGLWAH